MLRPPICRELREAIKRAQSFSFTAFRRPSPRGSMHQPIESMRFYVTMLPGMDETYPPKQIAYLLGPYDSYGEADAEVRRGRALAVDANPWHAFDSFGVSAMPDDFTPRRIHFAEGVNV